MGTYIISGVILILFLGFWIYRKNKSQLSNRQMSTSTTTTTTMPPAVANPTATTGYKFIETIEKYTLIDINKLQAIAIESETEDSQRGITHPLFGTGRCTTALAGLCFSTIEQIGLILRNDLNTTADVIKAIKGENKENAYFFFNFFSVHGLQSIQPAEIQAAYFLFRNKITHNLFPKHGLGVAQNIANPLNQFVILIKGSHSLNVNFLAEYIKKAVPIIKGLLADHRNAGLILNVDNNLQKIATEELNIVKNQYRSNPHLQTYYSSWLPHIAF